MSAISARPRRTVERISAPAATTLLGGIAVVVGAALPWLSTLAGLQVLTGLDGVNGRLLALGGVAAAILGVTGLRTASSAVRWASGLLGFALLAFSAWLLLALRMTAQQLAENPLALASVGPGLYVATAGAAAVFAPLLWLKSSQDRDTGRRPAAVWPSITAAAVAMAGLLHLVVGPQHAAENPLLGVGMVLTGAAQVAVAAMVALAPSRARLRGLLAVNVGALAAWAGITMRLLPIEQHQHATVSLAEPLTLLAQMVAVTGAFILLQARLPRLRAGAVRP